jgi:hypothetical protein
MAINFNPYYNNQFPQYYPAQNNGVPYNAYTPVQTAPSIIVIGIQGIEAAKAYPLGPNTRAYMFDTEKDYIYIKETDANGIIKGPLQILECKQVTEEQLQNNSKPEVPALPAGLITADNIADYIADYLEENNYRPYVPRSERRAQNEQRVLEVSPNPSN